MPGIDPATGLPFDLVTPQANAVPPGFINQAPPLPMPGAMPMSGAQLPPGFVPGASFGASPSQAPAPIPNLFQPAPTPPPAHVAPQGGAPQVATPVPTPHAGSHAQPGLIQQFDQQIAASQGQQQAAATDLAQVQQQGGADVGRAQGDVGVQRQMAAQELADKQAEIQKHNQRLDAVDAANLAKAKDATIPDFWAGRTGALVGSSIAVALSGIGAGLLGSTQNTALQAIQHNVDQYFHQQKEKIDNLYKYADAQGKLNTQTRMQYAQDLLNLKDQHSYVIQAAADRVQEVSAQSKGAADAATTKFLASKLGEQAIKDKMDVRELRSKMMLQEAQAEHARGAAAAERARASQGGYLTPQQVQTNMFKMGTELNKSFDYINRKGGLNDEAQHLQQNIKLANEQPNNPAPFVGLLDSLVTSYSGGKVTQAQFNNWLHHIAPGADRIDQVIEQFQTGKASATQRKNLMDIATGKYNGLRGEIKQGYDQYDQATSGPEFGHPALQDLRNRKKVELFGRSPGFGGKEPEMGGAAPGANPAAASKPTQMTLNGRVYHLQTDGTYQ